METKVCDQCKKIATYNETHSPKMADSQWVKVTATYGDGLDFCSLPCLILYAQEWQVRRIENK